MPQMMPLNWISLMLMFIMTFYLFNNMNYFNFLIKNKKKSYLKMPLTLNWKW